MSNETTLHRWGARWVWWRTGFTHWTRGDSYTYDPSCPVCRLRRLWRSAA